MFFKYICITFFVLSFASSLSYAADVPEVSRLKDGTYNYTFKNGYVCYKRPEFISSVDGDGALEIKKIFSLSGSISNKIEAIRNVSPKAQEFEAIFFDLCYQRGAGQLSEQEYQSSKKELEQLRNAVLLGEKEVTGQPGNGDVSKVPSSEYNKTETSTEVKQGGQVSHGDKSPNVGSMKDNATINIK